MGMSVASKPSAHSSVTFAEAGTQYLPSASGWDIPNSHDLSVIVDHPADADPSADFEVAYTVQVSNADDRQIANGEDVWVAYPSVTITNKSTAAQFPVMLQTIPFRRVRLKLVTAAAAGETVSCDACFKSRA